MPFVFMDLLNFKTVFNKDYYKYFQISNNTNQEVNFLIKALKLKKNDCILDIGCGNGRHLLKLSKMGFKNLSGIDKSKFFIDEALKKDKKNKINFVHGDFLEYKFLKKFDKVYSFFSGFGYYDDEKNEEFIAKISHILKKDSLFLLDLYNYFYFIKNFQEKKIIKKGNFIFENINIFNVNKSVNKSINIIINKKIGLRKKISYSMRYYNIPEILKILYNNYFEPVNIFGNYNKEKISLNSKRLIVVARKSK